MNLETTMIDYSGYKTGFILSFLYHFKTMRMRRIFFRLMRRNFKARQFQAVRLCFGPQWANSVVISWSRPTILPMSRIRPAISPDHRLVRPRRRLRARAPAAGPTKYGEGYGSDGRVRTETRGKAPAACAPFCPHLTTFSAWFQPSPIPDSRIGQIVARITCRGP